MSSLVFLLSQKVSSAAFTTVVDHIAPQLHKLQFGFLKGKSTTAQILRVLHNIGAKLDKRVQVDAIYLDFAKAFDRVNHKLMRKKVHRFGIHGTLS